MEDPILEAARAIRPYLAELLPADTATELDGTLAALLEHRAAGELRDVLARFPRTREWTSEFLAYGLPPEVAVLRESGTTSPPGHGDPVGVPKYVCPSGDFTFYRHAVGQPVPACPTHHCDLDRT